MKKIALFVFAHPDDESAILPMIDAEHQKQKRVICIYATHHPHTAPIRRQETLSVLTQFKVDSSDVLFLGETLSIEDGLLYLNVEKISFFLKAWINAHRTQLASVYFSAWEGGHQDHDTLHAVMVQRLKAENLLSLAYQFPFYHRRSWKRYHVLTPLSCNGAVYYEPIPWSRRLLYLKCCFHYPSQWKIWIGLFPFFFWHYAINGKQALQGVSFDRIRERPHEGTLFYERKEGLSWEMVNEAIWK